MQFYFSEKDKRLPFKNTGNIDLLLYVYILGAYVHMYAKHEVFTIKPVARGLSTDAGQCWMTTTRNGQFMIV